MCTAVVGGSIQRAARSVSAASDQRAATLMRNHRIKDGRKRLRGGVFESVSGIAVPSLAWKATGRLARACPKTTKAERLGSAFKSRNGCGGLQCTQGASSTVQL